MVNPRHDWFGTRLSSILSHVIFEATMANHGCSAKCNQSKMTLALMIDETFWWWLILAIQLDLEQDDLALINDWSYFGIF